MILGNFFKKTVRIFLWALAVASAVGGSFLCIAGTLALLRSTDLWGSENFFLSSICTLIASFFMAVFLFGKETIYVALSQPPTFLGNARRVLREMGYEVTSAAGENLSTRHGFEFVLFCRGIHIQCKDRQARITGSKIWVDALRRRLRLQNFMSSTELSLQEGMQRTAGLLLKRVHIQMRVPVERLDEVNRNVVQVLAQEAEIVCELSIMAQSDAGIREGTVEQQVRTWLGTRGITADIQKDLAKIAEPASGIIPMADIRRKLHVS